MYKPYQSPVHTFLYFSLSCSRHVVGAKPYTLATLKDFRGKNTYSFCKKLVVEERPQKALR